MDSAVSLARLLSSPTGTTAGNEAPPRVEVYISFPAFESIAPGAFGSINLRATINITAGTDLGSPLIQHNRTGPTPVVEPSTLL